MRAFKRLMRGDPHVLRARDAVGATPLLLVLLYNTGDHQRMARELIAEHPELCADQYNGAEYMGENGLHIAIVNGELVRLWCPAAVPVRVAARASRWRA